MSFLYPGYFIAAGVAALALVGLHFLFTEQARSDILPTVRFFPESTAEASSIVVRFSDPLLLLIRVLVVLLIGAAFAQPRLSVRRGTIARIVVVDRSRGNFSGLRDSAEKYSSGAAAVVSLDSVAREVRSPSMPAAEAAPPRGRATLSAALIAALHAGARERDHVDSLELIVVSPFLAGERDAATIEIRSMWPGRIQTVVVTPAGGRVNATKPAPMPVRVEWADSGKSTLWVSRPRMDTVGGVGTRGSVLIYPFVRRWRAITKLGDSTRVFARWYDGEPAGLERLTASGCTRSIGFAIPSIGDARFRTEFTRFADALREPCESAHEAAPLPAAFMDSLVGRPHFGLAASSAMRPSVTKTTSMVVWLLGGALFFALLELLLRRRAGAYITAFATPARAADRQGGLAA